MAKGLTIASIVVALLIFLLFALDLATGFPFRRASKAMDIAFIFCALGLGYISWTAFRDIR
ncbi:MAG: hypothetical protein KDA60_17810 [Planctomycetales bacterium]|nr:hypothetical protein [Planctomycetales bacterium]